MLPLFFIGQLLNLGSKECLSKMSHRVSHSVVKWSNCPRTSHTKVINAKNQQERGWDNSGVRGMENDLISDELKQLKKDQIEHEKLSKSLRVRPSVDIHHLS